MILRPAAASLDMSMALAALNAGSLRRKKNVHERGSSDANYERWYMQS